MWTNENLNLNGFEVIHSLERGALKAIARSE